MSELIPKISLKGLHFLVQDIHTCVELHYVERVLPLPAIEAVPGSPSYLVGLMNLAGKCIPIIDLSMRLGMQHNRPYSLDQPILLCTDGIQHTGIIVDQILGMFDILESDLQKSNDFDNDSSLFLAIAPINTDLALMLNMKKIMNISLDAEEIDLTNHPPPVNKAKKHHG